MLATLGSDVLCRSGVHDEQCERELEREQEEEQEEEREVAKATAASEVDWEVEAAIDAISPEKINTGLTGVQILSLGEMVALRARSLSAIPWKGTKVWVTSNFASSILLCDSNAIDFLRPVDTMLLYSSRDILLVSEREADVLLQAYSRHSNKESCAQLVNLAFLRAAVDNSNDRATDNQAMHLPLRCTLYNINRSDLVALQLFAGETTFKGVERKASLHALLPSGEAVDAALLLPRSRGTFASFDKSDLETSALLADAESQASKSDRKRQNIGT